MPLRGWKMGKIQCVYDKDNNVLCAPKLLEKEELQSEIIKDDMIISDDSISEYLKTLGIETVRFEDNQEKIGEYLSELTFKMLKEGGDFNS